MNAYATYAETPQSLCVFSHEIWILIDGANRCIERMAAVKKMQSQHGECMRKRSTLKGNEWNNHGLRFAHFYDRQTNRKLYADEKQQQPKFARCHWHEADFQVPHQLCAFVPRANTCDQTICRELIQYSRQLRENRPHSLHLPTQNFLSINRINVLIHPSIMH